MGKCVGHISAVQLQYFEVGTRLLVEILPVHLSLHLTPWT